MCCRMGSEILNPSAPCCPVAHYKAILKCTADCVKWIMKLITLYHIVKNIEITCSELVLHRNRMRSLFSSTQQSTLPDGSLYISLIRSISSRNRGGIGKRDRFRTFDIEDDLRGVDDRSPAIRRTSAEEIKKLHFLSIHNKHLSFHSS